MKKIKYIITVAFTFLLAMPVFAKETTACKKVIGSMDVKIPNTVHKIILVIQIVVPILLVIFGMIDLVKAIVASKEDEIKKAQNIFIRRLIMGALVFFVVAIVKLLVHFVNSKSEFTQGMWNCVDVFLSGVEEE